MVSNSQRMKDMIQMWQQSTDARYDIDVAIGRIYKDEDW